MTPRPKRNLPRLEKHRYQGHAVVFWTNTLEERARGWLSPTFHATFRELMLHAAVREQLFYPAYCLMPDHLHLIWMGLRSASDQLNAMKFLRTHLEPALGQGREWQHQPHDHVLREEERQRSLRAPDVAPSIKTFKQKLFTGDRRRRRRLGRGRHDLHQLHLCRPADRGLTDVLGLDPTVPALTAVLVGSERIVQPKT